LSSKADNVEETTVLTDYRASGQDFDVPFFNFGLQAQSLKTMDFPRRNPLYLSVRLGTIELLCLEIAL
jgi:hypothetical protein